MKRPSKKKQITDFQPTYVALAVASVAAISIVAFVAIGWSMSQ